MTIVRVGWHNDSHICLGGNLWAPRTTAKLQEFENYIGTDLNWCLGDLVSNIYGYPMTLHDCPDIEGDYAWLKNEFETETSSPFQCPPGNHDCYRDMHGKYFERNSEVVIEGLRFLCIDSTPKTLSERFPYPYRYMRGEAYGHIDHGTLMWLKRKLDEDPTAPTFIGFHHPVMEYEAGGKKYWRNSDSDYFMGYNLIRNEEEFRTIIEDPAYKVVAVICGHATHGYSGGAWVGIFNGITHIYLSHNHISNTVWALLDTEVPANSKVYKRTLSGHSDELLTTLYW